jgi:hypothetical protein
LKAQDLLAHARLGLRGNKRPRFVDLRRGVSDAYYALFHRLARLCADAMIGRLHQNTEAWRRIYRSLGHGKAKSDLQNHETRAIDPAIIRIAAAFVRLQEQRHLADYDPHFQMSRRVELDELISLAAEAIGEIDALSQASARELAASLIADKRK